MGEQTLKNIERPVRVYSVGLRRRAAAAAGGRSALRRARLLRQKPSIAVLPFNNMSGDPEQEYFADGITEDIITDLSKVSGLSVIARNSVFTYKGKPVDVQEVSRRLQRDVSYSKAACARPASGFASTRSSSTAATARISGPIATIAT